MFQLQYNCTHFTCQKIVLQILQARLPQYVNRELLHVQAGFRIGRGTRESDLCEHLWIIEKAEELPKKKKNPSTSASLIMLKLLCGSQQTLEYS